MQYLLYFHDGILRKFPLSKNIFTIGRAKECDLVIDENFISRRHAQVTAGENCITVIDLGSKNGIFIKGGRVKEARIALNESFYLKTVEFILKEGDASEFQTAPELIPVFKQIGRRAEDRVKDIETRYIEDASLEVLKRLLAEGLKCSRLDDFLLGLSNYLSVFSDFGELLLACEGQDDPLYSYRRDGNEVALMAAIRRLAGSGDIPRLYEPLPGKGETRFYSFPTNLRNTKALLLYFPAPGSGRPSKKTETFLKTLAGEIELVSQLLPDAASRTPAVPDGAGDAINTGNARMKQLIKETKRIAASDLFVLIEGESGTGKELFARLLHAHSNRRDKPLVAINCAAIPENLLESEFFGHEKGAFTGAHAQKKGRLELASGGILVLDEISEMPPSLQAKLLRALEENEFFRVGGVTPIKVNLRIVSLTNSRLQELIVSGKFRSDLYYRLVHHTISLPPLRERRDDIRLLINHFALLFSRQYARSFKGLSVKAFRALEAYDWPGNVRQLKNEVHRLVSLAGENGLADSDMLSEIIRRPIEKQPLVSPAALGETEDERSLLQRLLAKHRGNKSRAARELGMTYQGLHKKMKRLGLRSGFGKAAADREENRRS